MDLGSKEKYEKATYLDLNIIHIHFPNHKPAGINFLVFNNQTCTGDRIYLQVWGILFTNVTFLFPPITSFV